MQSDVKSGEIPGLAAVLETLSTDYIIDPRGRLVAARDAGVLPRFVLGRAAEGCVWRFRGDLGCDLVVALGRLAGRESGARFDGELPAPPERVAAIGRILAGAPGSLAAASATRSTDFRAASAGNRPAEGILRALVTRSSVTLGEIWRFV